MRSEMAQPCCGSSANVLRMRRSSVPCGRSIRSSPMAHRLVLHFYTSSLPPTGVEAQDKRQGGPVDPRRDDQAQLFGAVAVLFYNVEPCGTIPRPVSPDRLVPSFQGSSPPSSAV